MKIVVHVILIKSVIRGRKCRKVTQMSWYATISLFSCKVLKDRCQWWIACIGSRSVLSSERPEHEAEQCNQIAQQLNSQFQNCAKNKSFNKET